MLTVSVVLAVCTWAGLITPWLLLLFTFLIGCGSAFNAPAWQASVGDMVPRTELPGAVALNSLNFNIARSVGPAIGGAIVAAAGAAAAFAVNAASYVALIVVLARWRPVRTPAILPRESLGVAMAAGVRYVSMSPAIRTVLLRSAVFGAGASGLMALMPLVAKELLGGGPLDYGLMLGAFGVGAVAGAIGAARLRRAYSTETIVRWACVAFAIAAAIAGLSTILAGDDGGPAAGRSRMGAGARHVQRRGPAVRAALGRGARAVALPDGRIRRNRRRKLALGRRRGAREHHVLAAGLRGRAVRLRGIGGLAAARAIGGSRSRSAAELAGTADGRAGRAPGPGRS